MRCKKINKVYKLFLSGVLLALACFPLHAAESGCQSGLDTLKDCHCRLDPQSPFIYIAENAKIYNPDPVIAEQTCAAKKHKPTAKVEKKAPPAPAAADNETVEYEPTTVVLPAFPLAPSSYTFLQGGRESATISPQQRIGGDSQSAKANKENVYPEITKPDLSSYQPKQRQKLSPAATQCGMLTSFASASPPDR